MTETEVIKLPTAVFRENVQDFAGRFYAFLLLHINVVLFVILIILVVILYLKIKVWNVKKRARKLKPESTNDWFSWEDFKKWQESQKE